MQKRDRYWKRYFIKQSLSIKEFVIPYIKKTMNIEPKKRILEIGCGMGGNLLPFLERGCRVVGIDVNKGQIEEAKQCIKQEG